MAAQHLHKLAGRKLTQCPFRLPPSLHQAYLPSVRTQPPQPVPQPPLSQARVAAQHPADPRPQPRVQQAQQAQQALYQPWRPTADDATEDLPGSAAAYPTATDFEPASSASVAETARLLTMPSVAPALPSQLPKLSSNGSTPSTAPHMPSVAA